MTRFLGAALATAILATLVGPAWAEDTDATAVLDRAIKALGGEAALGKAGIVSWETKGTITFEGNDNRISGRSTAQGLDRYRSEFEGEFNGNAIKGVTVLDGDKGWRKFGDDPMELDADAVARERRMVYLQVVPALLVPLKGKGFKVEPAAEAKVDDKPASGIKATGPDGKDFTLYFDKASGLPVKLVARVSGFRGEEYDQVTTYADYKVFDGIKKATKARSTRDGEKFLDLDVTGFKVLDKVDPSTFSEPK